MSQGGQLLTPKYDTGTGQCWVGDPDDGVDLVTATTNPLTGGIGFNGVIVDMDETPDDTNTAAYPVGTLFISPEA